MNTILIILISIALLTLAFVLSSTFYFVPLAQLIHAVYLDFKLSKNEKKHYFYLFFLVVSFVPLLNFVVYVLAEDFIRDVKDKNQQIYTN